ncbi:beta-defensin 43-like [Saccopteryx bilineata]|uniref:beta-defensin 43-like n=1 Tax=Saccopteryx bilineata TaxID=59482 RepID=UPI00338DF779
MRILLYILVVLVLLSTVPPARSTKSKDDCYPKPFYQCRLKCKSNEYSLRYCADWRICCRHRNRWK